MVGCSLGVGEFEVESGDVSLAEPVITQSVSIMASDGALTKTSIGSDLQTAQWSSGDKIALWALADGAAEYSMVGQSFNMFYYGGDYSSAVFTADVEALAEGEYIYYASYPTPATINNTTVTYTIPAAQSGYYDGVADIMVSKEVRGGALVGNANQNSVFEFTHLMHAIRIEVPDERDLLVGTTKLQIIFPQAVVGTITFDVADAEEVSPVLSSSGSVITIDYDKELIESDYLWIFINPTTMSGDIEFVGYTAEGYQSQSITTTLNSRVMAAGAITPITLTVPEELPRTTVTLNVTTNNLGEEIQYVTLAAPSGGAFLDGSTQKVLPYSSTGKYTVEYYAQNYGSAFFGKDITVTYESENAIVSGDPITITSAMQDVESVITGTVPYLFEEDFSGVSSTDTYNLLTPYKDLPGMSEWSGRIYGYSSGNSIALRPYYCWGVSYYSALEWDLSAIETNLKSGKTVSLQILFYADWKKAMFSSVTVEVSNDNGGSASFSVTSTNSSASYTNITTSRSLTLSGCTSTSTITWRADGSSGSGASTSNYDHIYMDNIKIKIAN
ncbi:MAG: hypothetical protein SNH63_05055 [Rikenellaceae bacterium]